jgi:hypothetical protein
MNTPVSNHEWDGFQVFIKGRGCKIRNEALLSPGEELFPIDPFRGAEVVDPQFCFTDRLDDLAWNDGILVETINCAQAMISVRDDYLPGR